MSTDTIFALSSGMPPAAIAVVRISGPSANHALEALAGTLPQPRRAHVMRIHHPAGAALLDEALVLRFAAPHSATGEDVVELHLHGGRAVVRAVLSALATLPGLREAEPGEFTRRGYQNGRIDLAEAEGLADLLAAETESQRRAAVVIAGGALSRAVERWQSSVLAAAAQVEAALDFSDEADVDPETAMPQANEVGRLISDIELTLQRPPAERLREGVRVAIAGPPNTGKSSLLNLLAGRPAAITSAIAGTTRDLVEAPTAIAGMPFLLIDTAGLRESSDEVEAIGIERAQQALASADLILWLGPPQDRPDSERTILIRSMADLHTDPPEPGVISLSSKTGAGVDELVELLTVRSRALLPQEGEVATNARQRDALATCVQHLRAALADQDLIIVSEHLRQARHALDRVTGRAGVEEMLDALFGRFCIGK